MIRIWHRDCRNRPRKSVRPHVNGGGRPVRVGLRNRCQGTAGPHPTTPAPCGEADGQCDEPQHDGHRGAGCRCAESHQRERRRCSPAAGPRSCSRMDRVMMTAGEQEHPDRYERGDRGGGLEAVGKRAPAPRTPFSVGDFRGGDEQDEHGDRSGGEECNEGESNREDGRRRAWPKRRLPGADTAGAPGDGGQEDGSGGDRRQRPDAGGGPEGAACCRARAGVRAVLRCGLRARRAVLAAV